MDEKTLDDKSLSEFIKSMSVLSLQESDIIVFKTDMRLTVKNMALLKDNLQEGIEYVGLKNKVMLLTEGIDIGVLRKENIDTERN